MQKQVITLIVFFSLMLCGEVWGQCGPGGSSPNPGEPCDLDATPDSLYNSCCMCVTIAEAVLPALSVSCPTAVNLPACSTSGDISTAYTTWEAGFTKTGGSGTISDNVATIPALPTFVCGGAVSLSFTYEATDVCNTTPLTCTSTFSVVGNAEALSVSCPTTVNLPACSTSGDISTAYTAWVAGFAKAGGCGATSDNIAAIPALPAFVCGGAVSLSFTYEATDVCNTTPLTCTSTFSVVGNAEALSVSCPTTVNLPACSTSGDISTAYTAWVAGFAKAGGCGATSDNIAAIPALPAFVCGGAVSLSFTYEATDVCNTTPLTCTSTFSVVGNAEALSVSCPTTVNLPACSTSGDISTAYTAWVAGFAKAGGCGATSDNIAAIPALPAFVCGGAVSLSFTYEATDACGSTSCTSTFNVATSTALSISSCPIDITVECTESTAPPSTGIALSEGGCGNISVSSDDVIQTTNCGSIITRTWTATDECGNGDICTQMITVTDTKDPTLVNVPPNTNASCNAIPPAGTPSATDNCGIAGNQPVLNEISTQGIDPDPCSLYNYAITRTWTATDNCGNSTVEVQTITVTDTAAPTPPMAPMTISVQCADDIPSPAVLTASDNCGPEVTGVVDDNIVSQGQINRVWTFTDPCGNSSSVSQSIFVADTQPPVLQNTPMQFINVSCATQIPAALSLSAMDNCDGNLTVNATDNINSGACVNKFTIFRTWTAMDGSGNSSSFQQTITVNDDAAPVITCAPSQTVLCGVNTSVPPTMISDNCDSNIEATSTDGAINFEPCAGGTFIRTWRAEDECGNVNTCPQSITVAAAPKAIFINPPPEDIEIPCDNVPGTFESLSYDNNQSGFCQISGSVDAEVVSSNYNGCGGEIQLKWEFADACGRVTSHTQTITVTAALNPVFINPPGDIVLDCTDEIPSLQDLDYSNNIVGNCRRSGTIQGVMIDSGSICGDNGRTIEYTWNLIDCGTTITIHKQTITILPDDEAPQIMGVPADMTFSCDEENLILPASQTLAATDNCDGNIFTSMVMQVSTKGTDPTQCDFYEYTITRRWTAADDCGNAAAPRQQVITVINTAPTISVNPSEAQAFVDSNCEVQPNLGTVTITDCENNLQAISNAPPIFDASTLGANNIIYEVTDACGATASVQQTVNIIDNLPPTIACNNVETQEITDGVGGTATFSTGILYTATDNCVVNPELSSTTPSTQSFNCDILNTGMMDNQVEVDVPITVFDGFNLSSNDFSCPVTIQTPINFTGVSFSLAMDAICSNNTTNGTILDALGIAGGQEDYTLLYSVNGGPAFSSTTTGISIEDVNPSETTTYALVGVEDAQSCFAYFGNSSALSTTLTVNEPPTAMSSIITGQFNPGGGIVFGDNSSPSEDGSIETWEWSFDQNNFEFVSENIFSTPNNEVTVRVDDNANEGDYTASLTVTDENGCVDSNEFTFTITQNTDCQVIGVFPASFDICKGDTREITAAAQTSLTSPNVASWNWRIEGTGIDFVEITNQEDKSQARIYEFNEVGEYSIFVSFEDSAGCMSDEVPISIIVNDLPTVNISADRDEVCEGEEVTITLNFMPNGNGTDEYSVLGENIPFGSLGNPHIFTSPTLFDDEIFSVFSVENEETGCETNYQIEQRPEVFVEVNQRPTRTELSIGCVDDSNTTYEVSFTVTGQGSVYSVVDNVNGLPPKQVMNNNEFVSGPIPVGQPYDFTIIDTDNTTSTMCRSDDIFGDGITNCTCPNFLPPLNTASIIACEEENQIIIPALEGILFDDDDILVYILQDNDNGYNPNNTSVVRGSLINNDTEVSFNLPNTNFDYSSYFIYAVLGQDNDGNGFPEGIEECFQETMSGGSIPVILTPTPQAQFNFNENEVCEAESTIALSFNAQNANPNGQSIYAVRYDVVNSSGQILQENISSVSLSENDDILVDTDDLEEGSYSVIIKQIDVQNSNTICTSNSNQPISFIVKPAPELTVPVELCENSNNQFTLSIDVISNSDDLTFVLSNPTMDITINDSEITQQGNTYTINTPFPHEVEYVLTVSDGNCDSETAPFTPNCSCSFAGWTLSEETLYMCQDANSANVIEFGAGQAENNPELDQQVIYYLYFGNDDANLNTVVNNGVIIEPAADPLSPNLDFSFQEVVDALGGNPMFGTEYYIFAVVSLTDGEVPITDACDKISNGMPIVFLPQPEAQLSSDLTEICVGADYPFNIEFDIPSLGNDASLDDYTYSFEADSGTGASDITTSMNLTMGTTKFSDDETQKIRLTELTANYNVGLGCTSAGLSTLEVTVNANPVVGFEFEQDIWCEGSTVRVEDATGSSVGITAWEWKKENELLETGAQLELEDINLTDDAGLYNLIVTDTKMCRDSNNFSVVVVDPMNLGGNFVEIVPTPTPDIMRLDRDTLCIGEQGVEFIWNKEDALNIDNESALSRQFKWEVINTNNLDETGLEVEDPNYSNTFHVNWGQTTGSYTVQLTESIIIENNGGECVGDTMQTVTLQDGEAPFPLPIQTYQAAQLLIYPDSTLCYRWGVEGGSGFEDNVEGETYQALYISNILTYNDIINNESEACFYVDVWDSENCADENCVTRVYYNPDPNGSNSNGCGDNTVYVPWTEMVSTNDIQTQKELDITLYPNPNTGQFTLLVNGAVQGAYQIHVFDVLGRIVHQEAAQLYQLETAIPLDIPNAEKGMYYVRIQHESGSQTVKSFVVEKE